MNAQFIRITGCMSVIHSGGSTAPPALGSTLRWTSTRAYSRPKQAGRRWGTQRRPHRRWSTSSRTSCDYSASIHPVPSLTFDDTTIPQAYVSRAASVLYAPLLELLLKRNRRWEKATMAFVLLLGYQLTSRRKGWPNNFRAPSKYAASVAPVRPCSSGGNTHWLCWKVAS
jgi:hypothetical protein